MTREYDLRPLEFTGGRAAAAEIMSGDPEVGDFWRCLFKVYFEKPHLFSGAASDVDPQIANRVSDAFTMMMSRAPAELVSRYDSVMPDVRRFGTWDAMRVNGYHVLDPKPERLPYRPRMEEGEVHAAYGLMGGDARVRVYGLDDELIPALYRTAMRSPGQRVLVQADALNGYAVVEPPKAGYSPGELIYLGFEGAFGEFRPRTTAFSALYPTCGGELVVNCSRTDPAFSIFERHATEVAVDRYGQIDIRVGKRPRPGGIPLIHRFRREAGKAMAPSGRPLWRMEIPISNGYGAEDVIELLERNRGDYVSNGESIFVEGAARFYDVFGDRDLLMGEIEAGAMPADMIAVMTIGMDSQMALASAYCMIGICCPLL